MHTLLKEYLNFVPIIRYIYIYIYIHFYSNARMFKLALIMGYGNSAVFREGKKSYFGIFL